MRSRVVAGVALLLVAASACSQTGSPTEPAESQRPMGYGPPSSATTLSSGGVPERAPTGMTPRSDGATHARTGHEQRPVAGATAATPSKYRVEDFYTWRWPAGDRALIDWSFTEDLPDAWRPAIRGAAAVWSREQQSLRYSTSPGVVASFDPRGCGSPQLRDNAVHRGTVDGANGIVATTFTCIDPATAEAVSAQILLDGQEQWAVGSAPPRPRAYDLLGAVAHEFGHITGWTGHYNLQDPQCSLAFELMCPALGPGSTVWRMFGITDRAIFDSAY